MKKSIFILFIFFSVSLLSCKESNAKNDGKNIASSEKAEPAQDEEPVNEPFQEGVIDIQVNFPGNPMGEMLRQIDPDKGDYKKQMEELGKKMDPEKLKEINAITQANPQQSLLILFTPLIDNKIYVKGNEATAKCNGFTYHLENTIDGNTESGTVFMQSQTRKESKVTFKYDKDYFGKTQIQKVIDEKQYDRTETDDKQIIAGYSTKKTVYKAKEGTDIEYGITQLDVWTSAEMPKALNFLHPFYVKEAGGIMKITAYLKDFKMEYVLNKITPRPVTAEEMAIQMSEPIYDPKTETELQNLGMKLMETIF